MWTLAYIFLTLEVLLLSVQFSMSYNYCGANMKELCGDKKHFMCDPTEIEMNGEFVAHAPLSSKVRRSFLEYHNKLRSKIASGKEKTEKGTFPTASRMRELIWDRELAYIAKVHSARCRMKHDKCHNTKRFPYSGQNLHSRSGGEASAVDVIEGGITAWYNECQHLQDPVTAPDKYETNIFEKAGHFSAMTNDRVSRVGCSIAHCRKCGSYEHCYFMTCNYEFTNMLGGKVYTTGAPASQCSDWEAEKSETYEGLCENTGKIFPRI